ncbi:hypothetical protein Tco_1421922, partial [Tanacetum coccineum]
SVDEFVDEGVPENEPKIGNEEADLQNSVEESLKEFHSARQGPLPPVVIREPESGKFQPLPEVQGKNKEKFNQYIFQRRTSTQTKPTSHDESSSLYAELGLTDSETDSDEEAGPNPGDAEASQPPSSHVVHAGPNLEHMDLKASHTSIQPNHEQMDEEFTTTAYPNVQDNLKLPTKNQFLVEKSQEDEPEKTNTKSEVQSMVTVPIHQDTSSVPLMTTLVINLTVSQLVPTAVQAPLPTLTATATATTTTTTTTLPPIPPQPQQGSSDLILIQYIGELEQHMADMVEANQALEERLDKQGSGEVNAHNHTDQLLTDLAEARRKKKKRRDSSKTPPGSPPHQPPPPPPPIGSSGTPGASGSFGSSQFPSPPPPLSTHQSDQSTSTVDPSSLKTTDLAEYTAWTTTDTRLNSFVSSIPKELHKDDDTTPDEQAQSSGDEDIGPNYIPRANLRQNWWKPLTEDRPATREPA